MKNSVATMEARHEKLIEAVHSSYKKINKLRYSEHRGQEQGGGDASRDGLRQKTRGGGHHQMFALRALI